MIEVPALIPDLTNEEYHAEKSFFSRSALMDFDRCPYQYWARHLNPDRPQKDATPAMVMGSAFHALMLEPHVFEREYDILPPKVLLKHVGRETYDAFKKKTELIEAGNKIILSDEEFLLLSNMRLRLESNEQAMELIRGARIEHSFFWEDKDSGLLLKARPDILHSNMIVDLKTCADASERAIQNEVFRYGYDVQMSMIRDAVENTEGNRIENFILICIETKYPYNMGIYMLDEEIIDNAFVKYKSILLQMKNSLESNNWKDYGIQRICLPKWAVYG